MGRENIKLTQAQLNKEYLIVNIDGDHTFKSKLYSMGLNTGICFKVLNRINNGPVSVIVREAKIAVGFAMAEKIIVKERGEQKMKTIRVALAGNPNSGKTTIFNNLTGSHQHIGNYPGVTVEKKEGKLKLANYTLNIVDLPGTYSLTAYSIEEIVARNYIVDEKPDVVAHIVDCSNLERNLYLAIQLMELNIPLILVFNMSDVAKNRGYKIDIPMLSNLLNVPIVETVGTKKKGMQDIIDNVIMIAQTHKPRTEAFFEYGSEIENEISNIVEKIKGKKISGHDYSHRWMAIKLLEQDKEVKKMLNDTHLDAYVDERIKYLNSIYGDTPETLIADRRYGIISGACTEAVVESVQKRHDISDSIDKVVTNRILGLPIFFAIMWCMFQWTFTLAEAPMEWIEMFFEWLGVFISGIVPEGLLQSLLVDGIIGGVGGVLVFLPNIFLLFFFIALLEDSGYMARAAFVIDKIMHKIGLHGKSFIPMITGFGCTVPAYMGSRILENKKDRLITMHINTFMSCSARLPVYVLLCGTFWPKNAGGVMFSIYVIGIVIALIMAKVLRMTRFRGDSPPFVMELPIYRLPTFKGLLVHMWEKGFMYLRKAGTVILCVSVIIWALMTFPRPKEYREDYKAEIELIQENSEKQKKLAEIKNKIAGENLANSYAGRLGHFIEPVIKPLGFNWKIGVGLFAGLLAKEVLVATLGTIYSIGEADETSETLKQSIKNDPDFSPLSAYSLMIFVLIYFPCIASMSVFLRETGSWKETLFQMSYTTILAWILAFLVFQAGKLLGF